MSNKEKYAAQLTRIKQKLVAVKLKDRRKKIDNANSHQYYLAPPIAEQEVVAFENKFQISLPEDFRLFITQIGNGGKSIYDNSGAAPYAGIYPLDENNMENLLPNPEIYLSKPCILSTETTHEEWEEFIKKISESNKTSQSEADYLTINDILYQGLLPIGSQGCSYYTAIILNGIYRGKVVNTDVDNFNKPFICYENNFLDWYERWLDEIMAGYRIDWFGRVLAGNEVEVIEKYKAITNKKLKQDYLWGLSKMYVLSPESLAFLEQESQHDDKELADNAKEFLRLYVLRLPLPWWKDNFVYQTIIEVKEFFKTLAGLIKLKVNGETESLKK